MAANWFSAPAPVTRRIRGYFAPVARTAQAPVLFDPSQQGRFALDAPPAPWIDLGWIQGFARRPASRSSTLLTGIPAAAQEQVRQTVEAELTVQFLTWTKLTMALATGSQHMNLLAPASGAPQRPAGSQAVPAAAIQSGSTASTLLLSSSDAAQFSAGSIVAVDADYSGQTGFVGAPVSGAYLRQPLADIDYIRRVTFNVSLVSQVSSTELVLASPLIGGAPAAGAKAQAVAGFVDREGGCFYQEWSVLFVLEGTQGERIYYHYPRMQPMGGAEEAFQPLDERAAKSAVQSPLQLAGAVKAGSPKASASTGMRSGAGHLLAGSSNGMGTNNQTRVQLIGQFLALPVTDPLDAERVVCYRSFLPAPNALI